MVFNFERDGESNQPRESVPNANGNGYMPNAYGTPNFANKPMNFEDIPMANESDLPF
jgi:hypothetical protein